MFDLDEIFNLNEEEKQMLEDLTGTNECEYGKCEECIYGCDYKWNKDTEECELI